MFQTMEQAADDKLPFHLSVCATLGSPPTLISSPAHVNNDLSPTRRLPSRHSHTPTRNTAHHSLTMTAGEDPREGRGARAREGGARASRGQSHRSRRSRAQEALSATVDRNRAAPRRSTEEEDGEADGECVDGRGRAGARCEHVSMSGHGPAVLQSDGVPERGAGDEARPVIVVLDDERDLNSSFEHSIAFPSCDRALAGK